MVGLGMSPDTTPRERVRVIAVLAAAVVAIGASAPMVRGMEAGPLAVAAWRTGLSALLLSPTVWGASLPTRREAAALALAGVCLAAHFALWFAALGLTSVLRATVLVCLTPVWTAAIEAWLEAKPPSARYLAGTGVAVVGVAALSGGGGAGAWTGDALALFAGALWPVYLLLTRPYRSRAGVAPAMAWVCGAAAATLWPLAAVSGVALTGYPASTWGLLGLAVLLPQLVGHQGMAYALHYVPARVIATATLLEPLVATALAALCFGEWPAPTQLFGALLVLAGVGLSLRRS